jgi:hypothetical protein
MLPRDRSDFRKRVRRETLKGSTTFFHENIEDYILRQAKGYTIPRIFLHFAVIYFGSLYCAQICLITFPNVWKYGGLRNHPNYIKLGPYWSWFYILRVPFGKVF